MLLIGLSLLDYALEKTLLAALPNGTSPEARKLFADPSSALGSVGPKIDLAFAMGLISDGTRREAHQIRKVRNHFAHAYTPADFDEVGVRDRVDSMKAAFVEDIEVGSASAAILETFEGGTVKFHGEDFNLSEVCAVIFEGNREVGFLVPTLDRDQKPSREAIARHQLMVLPMLVVVEALPEWFAG